MGGLSRARALSNKTIIRVLEKYFSAHVFFDRGFLHQLKKPVFRTFFSVLSKEALPTGL
jgi:hypothetical protein